MSRNPSPAPQPPPTAPPAQRTKQKPLTIAAGAEDVKYQAKYKELKRKVKDIEADNDKLHIKVMNAKLTIQRMKMERAILYERLAQAPVSPSAQDRAPLPLVPSTSGVPPHQPASAAHHPRDIRDHSASAEPDQAYPPYQDYPPRTRGPSGHPPPPEGRPVSAIEKPPQGVAPSPHMQMPHSPRRVSGEPDARQRLPTRHMPSNILPHDSYPTRSSHASPPMEHDYPPPSHVRTRSQSSSRSRSHQIQNQSYRDTQYPEPLQSQPFSPQLSERERSRQSDMRSMPPSQGEPHGHGHHPLLSPQSSTSDLRARIHPHQRMGPGTYINREEYPERHRDLDRDREREWDHERGSRDLAHNREMLHSPHSVHRSRAPMERPDYPDHNMSSREDHPPPPFYEAPPPRPYSLVSRSDTPGSASASGSGAGAHNDESSRPDSRAQYYEQDRGRAATFRLRPVSQQGAAEDVVDFVHEDGRSRTAGGNASGGGSYAIPEQSHPTMESRKRSRNDMDVDSENDVGASASLYSTGRLQEDRGSKRYQRERQHRRSIDAHEDVRPVASS